MRLLLVPPAVLAVLLAVAALALPARAPAREGARPNVVVVMTDDQTLADMEAMPETRRLVGDAGATFDEAYVSYPSCCPSRATFLTGQYAHNHDVRSTTPPHGGVEALDADHTLPVWLEAAGYDTTHIGKYLNGYGLRRKPNIPAGWTDWHGSVDKSTYQMYGYTLNENGVLRTYGDFYTEDAALYQTDVLRDKALEVVRAHAGPEGDPDPFFLSLAFVAPHGEVTEPGGTTKPYVRPAPRHRGRFATVGIDSPAFDELDVRDKPPAIQALPRVGPAARERVLESFRARREALLAVDEAMAALVGELERTGQLENTYVVFTSDNGFLQGEHRIPKGKFLAYDASSHVPLLVRGPGIAPGTVTDEPVLNTDLAPTVLEATGARATLEMDGRSLLPFARDPLRRSARPLLHEGLVGGDVDRDGYRPPKRPTRMNPYRAIRTSRFLLVQWRGGPRELYDLARDPFELDSVHRDPRYAATRSALSDELAVLRDCEGAACSAAVVQRVPPPSRRARRTSRRAR